MITYHQAFDIVDSHIENKNLVKHCIAVEAAMRALARHFNEDEDLWGMAGLLHDADWEVCKEDFDMHTKKTIEWINEAGGTDERIINAIVAHNYNHTKQEPQNNLEWSLYCCDELTGLITATALMTPDKKLASVELKSVKKKFKNKKFAAAVSREQITLCEEKLGIPLDEFMQIVLDGMKQDAERLGL
jgi:putative nucleotidyltransferase with HDIG domain